MYKSNKNLCELTNRITTNLIIFGFARVDSAWNGTILAPLYSRLYYITDGNAKIFLKDGKEITLSPQKWYVLPSGCSFDFNCENHMEHIYFHLKICSLDGHDLLQNCKEPITLEEIDFNYLNLTEYLNYNDISSALYLNQFVENVLFTILIKNNISLKEKTFSPCVLDAISYISNNLSLQLSLTDILKNTFVAKSTLTKHFKKEMGMSIHEYIFDRVMFEAEQLIRQNKMSIGEISDKYKFYDQFYFSRCFKKRYGISPIEYRKTKMI